MHELVEQDAHILWHYMQMHQAPGKADCLLVLGGRDDRVATYAAQLAQQYHYWYVVVSGGVSEHNEIAKLWAESTEAEHFAAIMQQAGYTKPLILETSAQNTDQNAIHSFSVLQSRDTPMPLTIQLVTKPYMERRAIATFEAKWPDKDAQFVVSSPREDINALLADKHLRDQIINGLVGELNRIISLSNGGHQPSVSVPVHVHAAYTRLVAAGFTNHLSNN